jgi:hypothetical protein
MTLTNLTPKHSTYIILIPWTHLSLPIHFPLHSISLLLLILLLPFPHLFKQLLQPPLPTQIISFTPYLIYISSLYNLHMTSFIIYRIQMNLPYCIPHKWIVSILPPLLHPQQEHSSLGNDMWTFHLDVNRKKYQKISVDSSFSPLGPTKFV